MAKKKTTGGIDLMGWDTVFALRLDAVNNSIVAQKTTPACFDYKDISGGANVKGDWDPWSVTGGEGNGIFMKCPVKSGTMTVQDMQGAHDLAGGYVTVMITLAKHDSSTELPDSTAKAGTGKTKHFKANQSNDQFQKPRVQSVSYKFKPGFLNAAAQDAFAGWFENNVSEFDAVFSAVREEEEAIEAGKQWLKPYTSLYALAQPSENPTTANSAFGIVSMTSKPSGSLPQENFDLRMFEVFKDTKTPTNSVFAASSALSMKNIVQQSAVHCVMGSSMDDFHIVNDGITVANKNKLNWGKFKLQKDSEETVTPVISPGDFQLTLDGADFHLSISQAAFTTPDGSADIKLNADQYFNMGAVKLKNGKYYFTSSPGLGTNSIRADVTPNKGFEIAMIIESIVIGIALGFIGAGIGEALGEAATGAVEGADGAVTASAESVSNAVDDMSSGEVSELTDSSLSDATDSIAENGENVQGKSGIFSNKWKVWGGVLGGMMGIPIGVLPQIMTAIWNDRITEGNVPTVDEFAGNFAGTVQWPQISDWQVTGGTFRAAFLLGGNAKTS